MHIIWKYDYDSVSINSRGIEVLIELVHDRQRDDSWYAYDKRRFTFCIERASTVSKPPYEAHVRRLFPFILSVRLAEQLKLLDRDRWTINFLRFSFEEFDLYHHAAHSSNESNRWWKRKIARLIVDEITERFSHHREQIIPRATIREFV